MSTDFLFSDPPSPPIHSLPQPTLPQTPTSNPLNSDKQTSEPSSSQLFTSEATASEPLKSATIISESSYSTPLIQEPSSTYPSGLANTSYEIILYDPKPHNFLECINMFGLNAKKRASALMESTSVQPDSSNANWEDFQAWLIDAFRYLHQSSEIEKLASIDGAFGRREVWLKEEEVRKAEKEARLAAKQKAVNEREALLIKSVQDAMEQAALRREERLQA